MTRVGKMALVVGFALPALAAVVRAVTFDPQAYARSIDEELRPLSGPDVAALHSIASASSASEVLGGLDSLDVSVLNTRMTAFRENLDGLRARFHRGSTPCARYPLYGEAPADAEVVAEALATARLAPHLTEVTRACASWQEERDARLHEKDVAAEVVEYFSGRANPWTRLGVWMRSGATVDAARALRQSPLPAPALPEETAPAARAICETYAFESLMAGSLRVATRKQGVDLTAPEMHLLHPGMTAAEVRDRLGEPAEQGAEWTYHGCGARVRFDAEGRVRAIATPIEGWHTHVVVRQQAMPALDRASLVEALGEPKWLGDENARIACDGDEVLGYDRGPYASVLCFLGGQLKSVELRDGSSRR
jgi:hypothetical protein